MTTYEKYLEYVAACEAAGVHPISYCAWAALFPLEDTEF